MVNFSVFNEESLPFKSKQEVELGFITFFKVLNELKNKNLTTIRMTNNFKDYEIVKNITFQQFFGEITNREFSSRLKSFITNNIVKIDSPLVRDSEIEDDEYLLKNSYIYNGKSTFGGLACCDIWNTIAVSFYSDKKWNVNGVIIQKDTNNISIRHISTISHFNIHEDFFREIEVEIKLNITQENFWSNKEIFFPNKIVFCQEIEKQIIKLDKNIFIQAISLLRDVENDKKKITDYTYSGESQSVKEDPSLKKLRFFTIDGEKVYFDNHIKNFENANRMHFLEKNKKIYIGYIGKHLKTKKYK